MCGQMLRRAWLSLLSCTLACAPPVSTAPLGGTAWVPPEPSTDKRAATEEKPRGAKTDVRKRESAPPPPLTSTTSVAVAPPLASGNPTATSAATQFAFVPLQNGDKVTIRTRYLISARLNGNIEADAHERIEIQIIDATPEEVRELTLEYAESEGKITVRDQTTNDTSDAGKRYSVRFAAGTPRVSALSGKMDANDEKSVLFDLGLVTGYLPLIRGQLPWLPKPKATLRLSSAELDRVFGKLQTVTLNPASLSYQGSDGSAPEQALFLCALPIQFEQMGLRFDVALDGKCWAQFRDSRPKRIELAGQIRVAASPTTDIDGKLEATLSYTYWR